MLHIIEPPSNPHPARALPTSLSASRMWESSLTENSAPSTGAAPAKFTLPSSGYAGWLIGDKRLTRFRISLCDCESNLTQLKSCASPWYGKKTTTKKTYHTSTTGPRALKDKPSYSCANNFACATEEQRGSLHPTEPGDTWPGEAQQLLLDCFLKELLRCKKTSHTPDTFPSN